MNKYKYGTLVRMSAAFTVGGVDTNPTTLVYKLKNPAGDVTTYTYGVDVQLVKDGGDGHYHVDYTTLSAGLHSYRFVGTGAAAVAGEKQFQVDASPFLA